MAAGSMARVGLLGPGIMGGPMTRNVARAGHPVGAST